MTDELSIQNQRPSALPYVGIGGLLGAGGGYLGARYTTSPKYNSYEDILKESDDTFKKNVEEVIEEQSARDKAIAARQAGIDAGKNYDAELAKAKDANAAGIIKDENYLNLEKELEAKKAAIETRRTELINKEIDRLNASNKGTKKTANLYETLQYRARQGLNATSATEQQTEEFLNKLVEKMEYTGTPEQIKANKEAVKKVYKQYIQDLTQYMEIDKAHNTPKEVTRYLSAQTQMKNAVEKAKLSEKQAVEKLAELTGRTDLAKLIASDEKLALTKIANIYSNEQKHNTFLKEVLKNYTEQEVKQNAPIKITLSNAFKKGEHVLSVELPNGAKTFEEYIKTLEPKQQKELKKLMGEGITKDNLQEMIKQSEARLEDIVKFTGQVDTARESVKNAKSAFEEADNSLQNKFAQKNNGKITKKAYVKDGKVYLQGEKKPIKFNNQLKGTGHKPEIRLPNGVSIPKDLAFEYGGEKLTDAQIQEKAKAAITDDTLKAEIEARNAVQKALDDAKAKLPKGEVKAESEIIKEVEAKLGGTREELIKKAEANGKDDLAKLYERKIPNKKLALWMAGGAVALAGLGALLRPSSKEA